MLFADEKFLYSVKIINRPVDGKNPPLTTIENIHLILVFDNKELVSLSRTLL